MDDRIADRWYDAVSVTAAWPPMSPTQLTSPVPTAEHLPCVTVRIDPSPRVEPSSLSGSPDPCAGTTADATAQGLVVPADACPSPMAPAPPASEGPGDDGAAGMRAELRELTGQLLGALAADPVDRAAGRTVGARLARVGFTGPDALARTVEVLGPPLSAAAGPGRAQAAFAVLGAVASGHGEAVRKCALAAVRDRHSAELTGLRRAERARRLGDKRFRSVFEHAGIGTLVVADSGTILEANDTARAIVGRDLTRLSIGDVWDLVPPRDRAGLIDMWAAVRAGRPGHGFWRLDREADPDGNEVWVSLTAAMVDDETAAGGSYYAVTIEDVTSRHDPRAGAGHSGGLDRGDAPGGDHGRPPGRLLGTGADRPVPGSSASRQGAAAAATARLTRSIAAALRTGQFVVHYQPIVRLTDGTIQGAEALVRWDHPRQGLLSPEEFIGVAEESGLIVPLGLHVLETACRDAARWAGAAAATRLAAPDGEAVPGLPGVSGADCVDGVGMRGGAVPDPFVSVNLSVRQLEEPDLVPVILGIVERAGLDPRCLQLELVENLMIDAFGRQPEALHQLADAGIRIAIDDFGTGYSNFAYLPTLPVGALKLAGQFCARDEDDGADETDDEVEADADAGSGAGVSSGAGVAVGDPASVVALAAGGGGERARLLAERSETEAMDQMVEGIVSIAHRLGHIVTAESVETRAQAARMLALGVDLGQGHLFGRPMCADKMAVAFAAGGATVPFPGAPDVPGGPLVPAARDGHRHRAAHRHS
ncbi:EAL domain-containing protein [Pseudofrankia sp. BMG5.37]|uniref:EAL domain-containing protein n=1 Tax=Pseudofrankia sp. BMG5.37 TaxID=3050035 RepID=UPI0028938FC0|nr:EAL domain-containing protein [Pseudofrankia sp. BMG5.37]MDT3439591.1 EAL domain-containing protein [Pseudofrankia sp. BMG5.37]